MDLTKEQQDKFKKLGIKSFGELALLIPSSYEDYRLKDKMLLDQMQLIDATVESCYRTSNSLQITFYVHNFAHTLTGVIFHPKPYMMHSFIAGSRDYYYGMVHCKKGFCSMSMPKKVKDAGFIVPKYKTKLRSDAMLRFVSKNLTKERLIKEGIDEDIANTLLRLHFPDDEILHTKELPNKIIYALKYTEAFVYMKELANKRRYFKAKSMHCREYKDFTDLLPFRLTDEQTGAIEDIKKDFLKGVSAKRMVVGDVGSGKTMVILASAYMNYPNRSVLMAPTTILATQLYEEALKYLPDMKIAFVANKTKKESLDRYDFIIGTHALLYRELPDASLVMVDEQHRFSTAQRGMLQKFVGLGDAKAHYLQFSATPIPRTQAMIESAYIDVSLITSTPYKKDITSSIIHKEDFKNLLKHIKAEIAKGNQILIVYPLVEESESISYQSIDEAREYWEKNFANVYVTHGKDKEKEKILQDFRDSGDILISTTVVEVGISLPRLSSVVIVGAERLGLSTLHQLRGRVSRTGLRGYCFLYTNQSSSQRLDKFVKTTSGFDIANLDLKYRKSGDLLKGVNQSGSHFRWLDFAEDTEIATRVKGEVKRSFLKS